MFFTRLNREGDLSLHHFVVANGVSVLGTAVQVSVKLHLRLLCLPCRTHAVEVITLNELVLIPLDIHNHLQVDEFLSSLEIVDRVDDGLLSHGHDLLANILDDFVLCVLVWVWWLI